MITDQQIRQLRELLNSGADMAFFFSKIKSPEWLPALARNGFYAKPPPPTQKGNTIFHPVWPQTRFLIGLAATGPSEVAAVTAAIPATGNATVNEDIFRIAVALPPKDMEMLIPRIEKWLRTANLRWHSVALAQFVCKAAEGGKVPAALGVAANILAFRDAPTFEDGPAEMTSPIAGWKPEPVSRFESYEYGEFLTRILPTLTSADACGTVRVLCKIVDGYVQLRGRIDAERPGYDGSQFWRPSVAGHEQNSPYDAVTSLITALARTGEQEIKSGHMTFEMVCQTTKAFPWDIFRRLELYWMGRFYDRLSPSIIKEALLNREYVRSDRFDLEYGELAKVAFASLGEAEQRQVIAWIDEGPELAPGIWESFHGSELGKKQAEDWANGWRQKKLFWIKDYLFEPVKTNYVGWEKQFGTPEHPGFHAWGGSFESGLQSPMSLPDFIAKSLDEQAQHLRTWEPKAGDFNGPTKEALGNVFRTAIGEAPATYIEHAELFVDLPPVYVAAFFSALWETLKDGAPHAMTGVWKTAEWLVSQPNEETDLFDEFTRNSRRSRPWHAARMALARLLNSLLGSQGHPLPIDDKERIWPLLEQLATDPDPNIHASAEDPDNEDSMGPFNLSLNTVRGEAIHGVFSYIMWRNRLAADKKAGLPPEARRLLERHLDPAIEPTRTIRSIFGANINRLFHWDEKWMESNQQRIFSESHPLLDEIAWSTFITHAQPFSDVFDLLNGRFRRAVMEMVSSRREKGDPDPRVALGGYLVALYWGDILDLWQENGLLSLFFSRAPDSVRGKVIKFVGSTAKKAVQPIAPVVIGRLVEFWEWRYKVAKEDGGINHAEELANFVWWFYSEKFDVKWAATEMVRALELSTTSVMESLYLRRFSEIADEQTAEALCALELAVGRIGKPPSAFWFDDEAIKILSAALRSQDSELQRRAKALQDSFVKQGRYDYINLPKAPAKALE